MTYLEAQQQRNWQTCFGLAQDMISHLIKGDYEPITLDENGDEPLPVYSVNQIRLPVQDRGSQKIFAAAALVLYVLKQQLPDDNTLECGWHNRDDRAALWIDRSFDPSQINPETAAVELDRLKKLFTITSDPALDNQLLERQPDKLWSGPYPRSELPFVHGVFSMLNDFHGTGGVAYREVHMNDHADTGYIGWDQRTAIPVLSKEGLYTGIRK